jgi:hypothetical protein
MADDATLIGLEVEELGTDEHQEENTTTFSNVWPGQHRRKGSSAELPAPQRFLDLPIWMSAPAKRPELEEEVV